MTGEQQYFVFSLGQAIAQKRLPAPVQGDGTIERLFNHASLIELPDLDLEKEPKYRYLIDEAIEGKCYRNAIEGFNKEKERTGHLNDIFFGFVGAFYERESIAMLHASLVINGTHIYDTTAIKKGYWVETYYGVVFSGLDVYREYDKLASFHDNVPYWGLYHNLLNLYTERVTL